MADPVTVARLAARPVLAGAAGHVGDRVVVQPLPPRARWTLRWAVDPVPARLAGFPLDQGLLRAAAGEGDRTSLRLGPDEWRLIAPLAERKPLQAALEAALADRGAGLVATEGAEVALLVTGPAAATVLNTGCPLDLEIRAFPVAMATRTVLAKAEIVLHRTGPAAFILEIGRSFARYGLEYLVTAAQDL